MRSMRQMGQRRNRGLPSVSNPRYVLTGYGSPEVKGRAYSSGIVQERKISLTKELPNPAQ